MACGALEGDPAERGFLRRQRDAQGESDGLRLGDGELRGHGGEHHALRIRPCQSVGLARCRDVRHGPGYRLGSHQRGESDGRRVEIRGHAGRLWTRGFRRRQDLCGARHVPRA